MGATAWQMRCRRKPRRTRRRTGSLPSLTLRMLREAAGPGERRYHRLPVAGHDSGRNAKAAEGFVPIGFRNHQMFRCPPMITVSSKGFSTASAFMASTSMGTSPCPVITMGELLPNPGNCKINT